MLNAADDRNKFWSDQIYAMDKNAREGGKRTLSV